MTRAQRLRRGLLGLIVLALAVALGLGAWSLRVSPKSPRENVPVVWEDARRVPMHAAHVERGVACETCHRDGFERPPALDVCASCHADQASLAHRGSVASPTSCTTCHQFSPGHPVTECAACHAQASAVRAPLAHHATPGLACATCHGLHSSAPPKRDTCMQCHGSVRATHGRWQADADASTASAVACNDCHAPHAGPAEARRTCVGCHVERADAGPALAAPRVEPHQPAAHAECTTCHDGHAARADRVRPCESCHEDRRAAAHVAGHRECTSCHQPHAPTAPERSCRGCHEQTALGASHVDEHAECTSCHDPHRSAPKLLAHTQTAAGPCRTCHANIQPAHPVTAGPAGACSGCHTPHPAPGSADRGNACSSCHRPPAAHAAAQDRAFHAGKAACGDCHRAHDFDLHAAAPALCGRCHQALAAKARSGHQSCEGCHGAAHTVLPQPGCQSCHAREVHSAARGHARCQQCHDSHSGQLGAHDQCASCHQAEQKSAHGAVAGGCATCHQAHAGAPGAAQPPACTSCHAKPSLPGLHSVTAHAGRCESCHGGHGPPRADRQTCTGSCHVDRRAHQPEAISCRGCHMFRR